MVLSPRPRTTRSLPIIDISRLRDPTTRAQTVAEIRFACLDKGFFYLNGHNIDPDVIDSVFSEAAQFFSRPMSEKLAVDKALSPANRGYEPLRGQALEPGAPPDLKEGYYIGIDTPATDSRASRFINVGPNVWPSDAPGFQNAMLRYFLEMETLSALVLEGIALSLELEPNFFDVFCTSPLATLRLLHYPPQQTNALPGEKGCGAHTDFGAITILLQDLVGGLQVWDHDTGSWIDAEPLPGAFIVNLGDLIGRWTNERYRSTIHRVINRSGQERYSIPFFFSGNHESLIECIPSCLAAGEIALYEPVTVDAHIRQKYAQSYGT